MIHSDGIINGIKKGLTDKIIARKIYLSYPTYIFFDSHEREFELVDEVCEKFNLPMKSVQVAGSGKTGFSYYQNREFKKGESDLDLAIVDQQLFLAYTEIVFQTTRGFKDQSGFGRTNDVSNYIFYSEYILRGIFRPDLMPRCGEKSEWFKFFKTLSKRYADLFSEINAGIYLNEYYFEEKQSSNIQDFKKFQQ